MIRSIVFSRVLGSSREDLEPALAFFRALGFDPGTAPHAERALRMLAPSGGIELIAAREKDDTGADLIMEVADADAACKIAKDLGVSIRNEIAGTSDGGRYFEVEIAGLIIGVLAHARNPADSRGLEGSLDAIGKRFAIVVSRFNSFITERLLDGAFQALRQCGTKAQDITVVHVPGAFEIPSAARQLAESKQYSAIICIGCLLRGGTLHYEVIANEVTRGVGQAAQETGVPHAFGVLTCDTLEQAIDRAGLKSGNKGFEAGLAAVEMASLRDLVATAAKGDAR